MQRKNSRRVREWNPRHIGGRWALSPLRHPCYPRHMTEYVPNKTGKYSSDIPPFSKLIPCVAKNCSTKKTTEGHSFLRALLSENCSEQVMQINEYIFASNFLFMSITSRTTCKLVHSYWVAVSYAFHYVLSAFRCCSKTKKRLLPNKRPFSNKLPPVGSKDRTRESGGDWAYLPAELQIVNF